MASEGWPERVVYLAGELPEEDFIALTVNHHASGQPGLVLLDGPKCGRGLRRFLSAYQPDAVVAVGAFHEESCELQGRLGVPVAEMSDRPGPELWRRWFPKPEQVVVCPAQPRTLLLQAACLAGALRAPLWLIRKPPEDLAALASMLSGWGVRRVLTVGESVPVSGAFPGVHVIALPDEDAVVALYLRQLLRQGNIDALVVANPADSLTELKGMSVLAPLVALQHRAPLLLTNEEGNNTAALVREVSRNPRVGSADSLLLVADLQAIPMERRPNPVPGKDAFIEMEPLTPSGAEPFSFATGRLFHDDPGVVLLQLARKHLLLPPPSGDSRPARALVVSNPGGGLPLLELFSRTTARELRNSGYQTRALFGSQVTQQEVRRQLPDQDIFLWEGHHSTLVKDYGFPEWTEPLPPSLIFLQSCLALTDGKTHPLLERGAVAVVGSSTRIYSATGGAYSLAYFNALLYDRQSLGGALRQGKNFLLAYALLKEKRLGKHARLPGANLRSAWAFTLWGDPTLQLPLPPPPPEGMRAVRTAVRGNCIVVSLPPASYDPLAVGKYRAQLWPNTCLAGLLTRGEEGARPLVPFVFAEVHLPRGPLHQMPHLKSRVPANRYVFCWDARRRCGWLLVALRPEDDPELKFQVQWGTPVADVKEPSLSSPE
jgi:hypothetical protein